MGSIFNSCLSPKIQAKITENGRIAIYDANEYIRGIGYPTGTTAPTQRIAPNYSHGPSTPAIVDNNGHIIVEGKVGGRVTSSSNNGTIEFTIKSSSELTVDHVDTGSTYIENHFVLKDDIGTEMPNIAGVFDIKNNTAWTTDITFHKNDGSNEETTIPQTYGKDYVYPDWYDEAVFWLPIQRAEIHIYLLTLLGKLTIILFMLDGI